MPACPVCALHKILGSELLILHGAQRHVFNVEKAKQIVKDGRVAYLVPKPLLARLLGTKKWSSPHLDHVQAKRPGICIRLMGGVVLVDGIHRAARSAHRGLPFYAHLLTFSETQSCLIDESPHSHHAFTQEIQHILQINPKADIVAELVGRQKALEPAVRADLSAKDNLRTKLVFYSKL